jgi:hypothetical protein
VARARHKAAAPPGAQLTSGYSGTPLAKKLGIRAGSRLFLHAAPGNYRELVAPLPKGVRTTRRITADTDIIHAFASRRAALEKLLRGVRLRMRPDAAIWVSWPKRTCGVATDITEDVIRAIAFALDLVDIKVCAVDETWSGLKLVIRKTQRTAAGGNARAP